jgi:tRNA-dihydrouridine synthase B
MYSMQNVNPRPRQRRSPFEALFDPRFPLCLAPMVGLTHAVQRRVIQEYMPNNISTFWPTEMLNSRRIPQENLGGKTETFVLANEKNLVPQLLGNQEEPIRESVQRLHQSWGIVGVDINMGCPVQKALRHNYGVSLMGDATYAAEVVRFTVRATDTLTTPIPVSVKLRAVSETKSVADLIDFVQALVAAGADWITLHPRSPEQQRRGVADWEQVRQLKREVVVPIIGNGDIEIVEDIERRLSETGADKIMIGRALIARPWLVAHWGERGGLEPSDLVRERGLPSTPAEEGAEYGRMLQRYIDLCEEHFLGSLGVAESLILRKVLFFVKTTHVWLDYGHTLYGLCDKAKGLSELRSYVSRFFSAEQIMRPRTQLRQ